MRDQNYLFNDHDLRLVIENQERVMLEEIESIEPNRLLNTNIADLASYFEEKYKLEVPQIIEDKITADHGETKVDVSGDPNRFFSNPDRPFYINGTKITYFVPFTGDPDLFKCQSSMMSFNPPHAQIGNGELVMTYKITDHNVESVKSQFNGTLGQIKQLLGGTSNDVGIFNSELRQNIENRIKTRKEKLLKDQGLVADLGVPLRKRDDALTTYAVPVTPKKVVPQIPPASTAPFKPEPTLEWGEYENILSIILNMVMVIERSPSTFTDIKEEDFRNHFLVQLNGQYNGQATGETFNAEGKTDILIRIEGKNIFIAECKFWKGTEYILESIGQLLGYTSWRDTKTSILIFNRNKNFTEVLDQIPNIFKNHPNFKRELEYAPETGFRYVFHNNNDQNREVIITVLAFDTPKEEDISR